MDLRVPTVVSFSKPNSLPPLPRPAAEKVAAARNLQAGDLCHLPSGARGRGGLEPFRQLRSKLGGEGCSRLWTQRGRRGGSRPADLFRCLDAGLGDSCRRRTKSFDLRSCASSRISTPRDDLPAPGEVSPARRIRQKHTASVGTLRAVRAAYLGGGSALNPGDLDKEMPSTFEDPAEAEVRAQARLRRDLAEMRTGDDAVAFFTRHGDVTHIKILHCIKLADQIIQSRSSTFTPYDLVVIQEDRVPKGSEYYTISANGVVHFRPGQLSECTSLSEWVHQCTMYRVLTSMTFFRFYTHRKVLMHWSASVRYIAYSRRRQRLSRRLVLARPTLIAPLMQMKALVSEVADVPLIWIPEQCCHLDDFVDSQQALLLHPDTGALPELERKRDAVVKLMEALAAAVGSAVDNARTVACRTTSFANSRRKSSGQDKQEALDIARRLQLLHEDEASLGSCIDLADCMFQAALAASVASAAEKLMLRVVEDGNPDRQPRRLFSLTAGLAVGKVLLEPELDVFEKVLDDVWEEMLRTACAAPPIATDRALSELLERTRGHGHADTRARRSVRAILNEDRSWSACLESTRSCLRSQLVEAQSQAQELYEPFRRIQDFGFSWDQAAFCAKRHTCAELCRQIELMMEFKDDLSKFRAQRAVGVLVITGRELLSRLLPVPDSTLAVLSSDLISTAREQSSISCRRLDLLIKELDERPEDPLIVFKAYADAVEASDQDEIQLQAALDEVVGAHRLLRKQSVRIPLDDQVLLDAFGAKQREFARESLPAAKGFLTQKLRERQSPSPSMQLDVVFSVEVFGAAGEL